MRQRFPHLVRAGLATLLGLLLAGPLRAAEAPVPTPPVPARPTLPCYRIAQGDVLTVATWGQDKFSQDCQVNGVGTISLAALGEIPAAGLTLQELQSRVQEGLKKYLKHPQVSVTVRQYGALGTSVFVIGEVKTPGVYPLPGRAGLLQLLAAAGGPTGDASGQITIIKARTGAFVTTALEQAVSDAALEAAVELGDVVMVERKPGAGQSRRYSVLGEVPTPGLVDMPEGPTHVLDAMQKAGLLSADTSSPDSSEKASFADRFPTADLAHALLTRGEVVVPLNLLALLHGDTSQDLLLQPEDVLTVPRRTLIGVYTMGEVHTAGRHWLPPGATVFDLLNASGGVTGAAQLTSATLVRQVDGKPTTREVNLDGILRRAEASQNVALAEGDVLYVSVKGESSKRDWTSFLPLLPYLALR